MLESRVDAIHISSIFIAVSIEKTGVVRARRIQRRQLLANGEAVSGSAECVDEAAGAPQAVVIGSSVVDVG